jgi:hypothetical protein
MAITKIMKLLLRRINDPHFEHKQNATTMLRRAPTSP